MANSSSFRTLFPRLLGEVKPYRNLLAISIISILSLAVLGPLRPYIIGKVVDRYIVQTPDSSALLMYLIGIFGLLAMESVFSWMGAYYANLMAQSVIRNLRQRIFSKILRFQTSYFDRTPVGNSVTRIVSDVEAIAEVFSSGLMEIIGDLISLIVILGFMFFVDWKLTWLS